MIKGILLYPVVIAIVWCLGFWVGTNHGPIYGKVIEKEINITIRIPSGSRWNYSNHQAILEAYQIEAMGRRFNKGEHWVGKYIESMIRMNTTDSLILDSILPLKPGQKIVFSDAN